jgi:hypothetical protein
MGAWAPVKVALRRLADLPDLESFLLGGSAVQGVVINPGDRFLLFGETFGDQNGIFVLDPLVGEGWYRPTDANTEDDFEYSKTVQVADGDYSGRWIYGNRTFPGLSDPGDNGANVPLIFLRGYLPDPVINPFALPTAVPPVPAPVVQAPDTRAPVTAGVGGGVTSLPPTPGQLGFPLAVTVLGESVTLQGEPVRVRV